MADELDPTPAEPIKDGAGAPAPDPEPSLPLDEAEPEPEPDAPTEQPEQLEQPDVQASSDAPEPDAGPEAPKGDATQTLKDGAARMTREAGDRVRAYVDEGKTRAGGALDELSKMLNDAAGTVDEKLGGQYGQYARSAADMVSGFSDSIKAKELDDLIDDARGFVQKSPAVAIGTAAALGFVLVRLVKSGLDAPTPDA